MTRKTFALVYPEDSTSRYKGQEAHFHAVVKTVKAHMQPEPNDEWAKSQGDYQDLADMRAKLLEALTEQAKAEAQAKLDDDAIRALIEHATEMEYPPVVVDEGVEEMVHDLEHRLSDIGYKLDDYLKLQGTNAAAYRQQIRPQAEERAKGRLAISALARDEKIEVTPEEINARIEQMLPSSGEDNPEVQSLREVLNSERGREMLRQEILTEKTLARLREIVTGKASEGGLDRLRAPKRAPSRPPPRRRLPSKGQQRPTPVRQERKRGNRLSRSNRFRSWEPHGPVAPPNGVRT